MADETRTFYEILNLEQGATQAQVSEAFRKLVKENHPDQYLDPVRKAEAERFLKEVTEAYNTLSKPGPRAEYDKALSSRMSGPAVHKSVQEQVRELLSAGLLRYRGGDYPSSLTMLDHVLRLDPENEQALFYAGMIRLKNPRWRVQGSQQVEKAIEKNPFNPSYVAAYAEYLLENGLATRALRLLESALPNFPADERVQVLIAQAKGGEKSGGFGLFRKKT
jgi:curved DNA-binding protein CbpA